MGRPKCTAGGGKGDENHSHETIIAAASLIGPFPRLAGTKVRASLIIQGQDTPPTVHGAEQETRQDVSQNMPRHSQSPPPLYEIAGLYTQPAGRGRGLGRALVKAAVARAVADASRVRPPGMATAADEAFGNEGRERPGHASSHTVEIRTVVYISNRPAIAFYEKCGFVARGPPRPSVNPLKT